MAFPGPPAGGTVHAVNADALSKTVEVPAHDAGDMLLLVCGWDGTPTVTIPDVGGKTWTNLATNSNGTASRLWTACILDAAGNASTEDITLTLGANERGTARIYKIPGAHLTTAPVFTNGFSNSADFDPAALDPATWDVEDTLWIVVFAHDAGTVTVTAAPSGYTGLEDHQIGNASAGAGFALAYRNNAVASEDPGTWTVTAENHAWAVIAVRPGVAAFTGTLAVTQASDTLAASGTVTQPPVTGTLAVTQAADTLAASGVQRYTGTLGVTQAGQTLAASGTSGAAGVSGTLAQTQAANTLSATGVLRYTGTLAQTQAAQTLVAAGTVTGLGVAGSLAVTQQDQTLAAVGALPGPAIAFGVDAKGSSTPGVNSRGSSTSSEGRGRTAVGVDYR